ncbi:hypothetical protein OAL66_01825 [bacterium]|nr:hypothetical protein [bacterium]
MLKVYSLVQQLPLCYEVLRSLLAIGLISSSLCIPVFAEQEKTGINQKDPEITASEQLTFVECKKLSGDFEERHREDMMKILKFFNVDSRILETQRIKDLVQADIDKGVCDYYSEVDSVFDLGRQMKEQEASAAKTYSGFTGWKLATMDIFAEGECRTIRGEFTLEERADFVENEVAAKDSLFVGVSPENLQEALMNNLGVMAWLIEEKRKVNDCGFIPTDD